MDFKVLHITDLHLNNFEKGLDEHLRKGFYQEYIDNFITVLNPSKEVIDFLLITGDFVDRSKIENFKHIKTIIKYITRKLKLTEYQVGVCIGNHDYDYKKDNGKNSLEIRKPYYDFSRSFVNKSNLARSDRFSLHKVKENVFFLSIDSTLDTELKDYYPQMRKDKFLNDRRKKPGKIKTEESDSAIEAIKKHVDSNSLLLIGCHYPIEKFVSSALYGSEDNFDENHSWNSGYSLRDRINSINTHFTCWFFGDTHTPDAFQYGKAGYIMTGRFGTSVTYNSQQNRQAKVVKISNSAIKSIITLRCEINGHNDSATDIKWKKEKSTVRYMSASTDSEEDESDVNLLKLETTNASFIQLINEDIENEIITKIEKNSLYSFGRFRTGTSNTSLGWIAINPLLSTGQILPSIVSKSKNRLQLLHINNKSSIIIGLDFWGSIIGSQVSVVSGIISYCIATRGKGEFHSDFETNHDILVSRFKSVTDIVFFTDVVSCGNTIHDVIEKIEQLRAKHKIYTAIDYHVIAVIAGHNEIRPEYSEKIRSFGSFCKKLKIPIVNDSLLPSPNILPYDIDFNRKD